MMMMTELGIYDLKNSNWLEASSALVIFGVQE